MSTTSSIGAMLGIVMLSACGNSQPAPAATAAAKRGVLAQCPATSTTPAGARRLGDMTATGLPLTDASIATIAPADYDPSLGNLNESEADEIEGDPHVTAATFSYAPSLEAVSLVCRYGKSKLPLSGEAMLLIPLKPQWAQCRFVATTKGKSASMICRPTKPE